MRAGPAGGDVEPAGMLRLVGDGLLIVAVELFLKAARALVVASTPPGGVSPGSLAYGRWEEMAALHLVEALICGTLAGMAASTGLAFRAARR